MKYPVGADVLLKTGHSGTVVESRRTWYILNRFYRVALFKGQLRAGHSIVRVTASGIRSVV